jgi:protoheme IX farnesyltransferase
MKASIIKLVKLYFDLAKPERTITNTITAVAGFLFASQWHIDWLVFLSLIGGLTLVIASACVFNNLVDRDLDRQMSRTKSRALPARLISAKASSIYGGVLGLGGFLILTFTNWLTVGVIALAFISYVVVYGVAKRRTIHSTLIGTLPGGASLVAGYTAVTNQLDGVALILFLIMLSWQMVHFYAIAIYRLKDYTAAKIPVLSVKKGVGTTKIYMLVYLSIFIFATTLLTWTDHTGYIYLAGVITLSAAWLYKLLGGFSTGDDKKWARDVFKYSLVILVAICLLLATGPLLP